VYQGGYHTGYTAYQCLALARSTQGGGQTKGSHQDTRTTQGDAHTRARARRAHKGAGYTESVLACLTGFFTRARASREVTPTLAHPQTPSDYPASRPLEWGTDSAEGGHSVGLAYEDVTQKVDQVFPHAERSRATGNSAPRRQEGRASLVTLEQPAGVCEVAGLAAVRAGAAAPQVPVAEAV
jgi:hypothetical protein